MQLFKLQLGSFDCPVQHRVEQHRSSDLEGSKRAWPLECTNPYYFKPDGAVCPAYFSLGLQG